MSLAGRPSFLGSAFTSRYILDVPARVAHEEEKLEFSPAVARVRTLPRTVPKSPLLVHVTHSVLLDYFEVTQSIPGITCVCLVLSWINVTLP